MQISLIGVAVFTTRLTASLLLSRLWLLQEMRDPSLLVTAALEHPTSLQEELYLLVVETASKHLMNSATMVPLTVILAPVPQHASWLFAEMDIFSHLMVRAVTMVL